MKKYLKPNVEYVDFTTEEITDAINGDLDTGSADEENPFGGQ